MEACRRGSLIWLVFLCCEYRETCIQKSYKNRRAFHPLACGRRPASLRISSCLVLASSAAWTLASILAAFSFFSASAWTVHTRIHSQPATSGLRECWTRPAGVLTRLVGLRVLFEFGHEVIKLLLPLVPSLHALLLEVWVVSGHQLLLRRHQIHGQDRSADPDNSAASCNVSGDIYKTRRSSVSRTHATSAFAQRPQFVGLGGIFVQFV